MRTLVFLLVLANLLFFAWTQGYFVSTSSPDALREQQQLLADQVRIVPDGESPAKAGTVEKTEKPPEKKAPDSCLLWEGLPVTDADRLEGLLEEKFSAFRASRSSAAGNGTYWVYIPPLANKQDADRKAAELKRFGAPEFFIVQDAGPNRLAISLGIFSSEVAANEHLEALRAKGIKSARVGERSSKAALASVEIHGPEAEAEALRGAAAALALKSQPAACKASVQ